MLDLSLSLLWWFFALPTLASPVKAGILGN
jgi:hypothetical protein